MGIRRQSREATLQMLYLCDNCHFNADESLHAFFDSLDTQLDCRDFARQLFFGAWEKRAVLDELITRYAENWALDRMAAIDRNILRLAIYEIMDTPETPINVIIDEAVEIAKKYSTSESSKFVNGILDKLKTVRKPGSNAAPRNK